MSWYAPAIQTLEKIEPDRWRNDAQKELWQAFDSAFELRSLHCLQQNASMGVGKKLIDE
jgi:hypothetical protein